MDEITMENIEKKVIKAKTQLILNQPFFSSLVLSYRYCISDLTGMTAATDGETVYIGPDINNRSVDQTAFILCHEVMHNVLLHTARFKPCKMCWNLATDHVVNTLIINALRSSPVRWAKVPDDIFVLEGLDENLSADEVYYIIHQRHKHSDKNGNGGKSGDNGQNGDNDYYDGDNIADAIEHNKGHRFDEHIEKKRDSNEVKKMEQYARAMLSRAIEHAKSRGLMPGGLESIIEEILEPQMNWAELLRDYIMQIPDDYTFNPPDRRFDEIFLPVLTGETLNNIAVALDTSGSMSDDELKDFISEIIGLKQQFSSINFTFIQADARVQSVINITDETTCQDVIKTIGRGGTDYKPVFKWVKDNMPDCLCLIYLTDGECPFPEKPPWDIIWIINNDRVNPPYGKVVRYKRRNGK